MKDIVKFLVTRKGVIATFIMTLAGYLASKGMIGEGEIVLVGSICGMITGSVSLANYKTKGQPK